MKRFAVFVELAEDEYRAVQIAATLRGQTMKAFTWDALRAAMAELTPGDRRMPTPAGEGVTGDART